MLADLQHAVDATRSRARGEQLDVAFIRTSRVDPEHLVITPLLDEPMMVAVPEGRDLIRNSGQKALSMKQLAEETFVLFGPPGTGVYDATIAACRAAGFSPLRRIRLRGVRIDGYHVTLDRDKARTRRL